MVGKPAGNAIWITSELGDVFVFDPANMKAHQTSEPGEGYVEKMDVSTCETPYYNTLYNG